MTRRTDGFYETTTTTEYSIPEWELVAELAAKIAGGMMANDRAYTYVETQVVSQSVRMASSIIREAKKQEKK